MLKSPYEAQEATILYLEEFLCATEKICTLVHIGEGKHLHVVLVNLASNSFYPRRVGSNKISVVFTAHKHPPAYYWVHVKNLRVSLCKKLSFL